MGLRLVWKIECCVCGDHAEEAADVVDSICDCDPVRVKQPRAEGWENDGLGGWMCSECYAGWEPGNEKAPANPG